MSQIGSQKLFRGITKQAYTVSKQFAALANCFETPTMVFETPMQIIGGMMTIN